MRHILRMAVCDSLEELFDNNCSLWLGKAISVTNFIEELAPRDQLSHEVNFAPALVHFEKLHDVWVSQCLERLNFLLH